MATDQPPAPDTRDDSGARPDRRSTAWAPHQRPRWVTVSMIIAIIVGALLVLMVILQLLGVGGGMGGHGPGRHLGLGATPPMVVLDSAHAA
jgi:hypothetical protein